MEMIQSFTEPSMFYVDEEKLEQSNSLYTWQLLTTMRILMDDCEPKFWWSCLTYFIPALRKNEIILWVCKAVCNWVLTHIFFTVLLYPKDRPVKNVKRHLRQPGCELLSSGFTNPPKRPKSPIPVKPTKGWCLRELYTCIWFILHCKHI